MFQLRRVVVRGPGQPDAGLSFHSGANILAGLSDTGKSYLVHCLDYIFGAKKMTKQFPEAQAYTQLYVQFANDEGEPLTLYRALTGGDLQAYKCAIDDVRGTGEVIVPQRYGKSLKKDVTSALFPFADLSEASLRKNVRGELQRLTLRHWMPTMLVDEVAVIDERSPVQGKPGYDTTINERAFAFMLSGRDDAEIVAAERNDVIAARLRAKLGVIDALMEPIQKRLDQPAGETEDSIDRVETAIAQLSTVIEGSAQAHEDLQAEREVALAEQQRAEGQVIALDELLNRYRLLESRYVSDLDRLDFIAEGAHYFGELQTVACPLCDQAMEGAHNHGAHGADVQRAARAEGAKIKALRRDLTGTIENVEARRAYQQDLERRARSAIRRIDGDVAALMSPTLRDADVRLTRLVERRVLLEAVRSDRDQLDSLKAMRQQIERDAAQPRSTAQTWEFLPSKPLDELCQEIEQVLADWSWPGKGRVTFNHEDYDIVVDGQPRQSHGKGVRGVLYSAFVIGLMNYCRKRGLPHPGLVVIDSPLTAYSKVKSAGPGAKGVPVDAGVEAKFWDSLKNIGPEVQVIIVENKRPPDDVAEALGAIWFAGESTHGQRFGFFPPLPPEAALDDQ
ncbi:ATP-binding protein [soil metagenome]